MLLPKERFIRVCIKHNLALEWLPESWEEDDYPFCSSCQEALDIWGVLDSMDSKIVAVGFTRDPQRDETSPALECPNCEKPLDFQGHCKYLCKRCGFLIGCSEGEGGF